MMINDLFPTGKVLSIPWRLPSNVEPLCYHGLQQPLQDNGQNGRRGKARITLTVLNSLPTLHVSSLSNVCFLLLFPLYVRFPERLPGRLPVLRSGTKCPCSSSLTKSAGQGKREKIIICSLINLIQGLIFSICLIAYALPYMPVPFCVHASNGY